MSNQPHEELCATNRRGFLGLSSALAMAAMAGNSVLAAEGAVDFERELNPLLREKVNVKFLAEAFIHEAVWEGPCRTGTRETLSYEAELARLKAQVPKLTSLAKRLGPDAHALATESIEVLVRAGDVRFLTAEKELAKLEADKDDVDLYVFTGGHRPQFPAVEIGKRFKKPIAFLHQGGLGWMTAMPQHLRAHGIECYVPFDLDELNAMISRLRVRKAFRKTKLLAITEGLGRSVMSGIIENVDNLKTMKARLGIDYTTLSFLDFLKEFNAVAQDERKGKEAYAITDRLMQRSHQCHMTRENIKPSVDFYLTVRHLFEKHHCNAFSIGCFEFCTSTLPAQKKITPCLVHSLLKDQGYPSACEGDLNALATIALFQYLAGKSVHMGNPIFDAKNGRVCIHHDVPGRKMRGFDQPDMPYDMMHFTVAGWGTTLRHDWAADKGQPVTFGRFSSDGSRLLISRGEIDGGYGLNTSGCSHGVWIRMPKAREFFHKELEVGGHHLSMVYGDYREEIHRLGEVMNFEVVEVS